MSIIALLIGLLLICLVLWATRALLKAYAVEEPIATTIFVIVVVLVVLALLGGATGHLSTGGLHL